ncbi:MAG TPA: D-2-hydroxyacid dehydrogenase [Caulobacteraceae bacterium]|nr:D-2-hydroxyacid dehydrogenase [Caulobacteraceae bacterium]
MRLIVHEPALRRVERELAAFDGQIELLVADDDGEIRCNGRTFTTDDAQPEAGWLTFGGAGGRTVAVAVLKSERLGWAHTTAAGLDDPIWAQIIDKGALLTTGHGQAISIAEYVLSEVLCHFQRIAERRAKQAAHLWKDHRFREVAGTRWLMIGFGAIGQAVAERARAFGAEIVGVRRSGAPHPLASRMAALADVTALLPEADVVVLAAPLNPETTGLADAAFFAAMKPGSVLVNVGRGRLVDEAALLAALDRGAPGHAVLDVFHVEPLPQDSPFWDHPRVALSPHASAYGSGQAARNDAIFVENLRRRLAGEPLLHLADPRDLGR